MAGRRSRVHLREGEAMIAQDIRPLSESVPTTTGADLDIPIGYERDSPSGTPDVSTHITFLPLDHSLIEDDSEARAIRDASTAALDRWASDNPY